MFVSKGIALAVFAAGALFGSSVANAKLFTAEYVFGDSLSDTGNIAEVSGTNFPFPPSYHDSITNGPVAVQLLAQSMGLNADPSLWVTGFQDIHDLFGPSFTPGTNYAVAGATSALAAVGGPVGINLPEQIAAYSAFAGGAADPNALYVIMIGGNDVRNAALQGTGLPAVQTGVQTELAAISTLSSEEARNFLIVNVPNVGIIPEFAQDNPSLASAATAYSQAYDSELAAGLSALTLPVGATLDEFDLYGLGTDLLGKAAALGFTNTTDRCFTMTPFSAATTPDCGPDGANIASFVYWDSIHPTARVQALWAQAFGDEIGVLVPVPEESTWALMLVGFAALSFAAFRQTGKTKSSGLAG
jgi:phospholipase/lecithinase/hemolysin